MDDPILPVWVILLLGTWSIVLTVWQYPAVNREVRLWAGLLILVYLVLIFLAMGTGLPKRIASPSQLAETSIQTVGVVIGCSISLIAGVWMLGRISPDGRRICYLIVTLANAAICALLQGIEIAIGLLMIAGITAARLMPQTKIGPRTLKQIWRQGLAALTPHAAEPTDSQNGGETLLIGLVCGLATCTLLGTLAYSLRHEVARPSANSRLSALPLQTDLATTMTPSSPADHPTSLISLVTGPRSDVIVLLAVIVFLSLATSGDQILTSAPARQPDPLPPSGTEPT